MFIGDGVGSGGHHGGYIGAILGMFGAHSINILTPQRTHEWPSLLAIGVPMMSLLSHSHPPTFLHHPCSPSLSHSPAPYPTKALLHLYGLHVILRHHRHRPICCRHLWCLSGYFSLSCIQMWTDDGFLRSLVVIDGWSTHARM